MTCKGGVCKMTCKTRSDIQFALHLSYNIAEKRKIERLYNCKAWIIDPDKSDYLSLQSYSTIVATYQRSTGILWVFSHYSNTTVQHVAKFRNYIRYKYRLAWTQPRIVRLYNDSRTGKRAAQKNLDDDFASVISTALNKS